MTVSIHHGDSREVLKTLADASVDSVVCDPPYALVSITKRFGKPGSKPAKGDVYQRAASGFMSQTWDTGETAFAVEFWAEVMRVLKPGGHVVAFSGTRTYHRLACAVEDAGFEIRDMLSWLYGSGFPKSHDVSKGIDKAGPPDQAPFAEFAAHYEERRKDRGLTHAKVCAAGGWHGEVNHGGSSVNWANGYGMPTIEQWAILQPLLGLDERWAERVRRVQYEREVVGRGYRVRRESTVQIAGNSDGVYALTSGGSEASRQWEGWGTALKPACEPIVLARKPLQGTVAANVLAHGTGALNIDGCRIEGIDPANAKRIGRDYTDDDTNFGGGHVGQKTRAVVGGSLAGRWPANVLHDGSDEVVGAFPDSAGQQGDVRGTEPSSPTNGIYGDFAGRPAQAKRGDEGSAARFFYSSKADATDRLGSKHPTVKPTDLMRWLVRLVTPPGGTVLDPFAGSGSTGVACIAEGFDAILIEREAEYVADIRRRIAWAQGEGRLTAQEMAKKPDLGLEGLSLFE